MKHLHKFISIIAAVGMVGCSAVSTAVNQIPKIDVFYKRDLKIWTGKHKGEGVIVLPYAQEYDISFSTGDSSWRSRSGDMDVVRITSCHRQEVLKNEGSGFTYVYKRQSTIEDKGSCPLRVETFDTDGEHHHAAYIEFETPELTMPAYTKCDGEKAYYNGVSVCQGHVGLLQKISFSNPMKIFGNEGKCKIDVPLEATTFTFKMPRKRCQYGFVEVGGYYRKHRLTTIGYDSKLLGEI